MFTQNIWRHQKSFLVIGSAFAVLLGPAGPVFAANEYWVGASGTTNAPTSGTWMTTTPTVWSDGTVNTADAGWTSGNAAIFGGVDSQNITVTVGGAITMGAGGILFNNSGYTLSAASAETITGNASGTGIFVASGKTATIGNNVTLTTSSSSIYMTVGATAANANGGTVDVASGGTLSTDKGMYINGVGTLVDVQTGGALNTANQSSSFLGIGNGSGSNPTLQIDGGTVTIQKSTGSIWLSDDPTYSGGNSEGTLTINSGTVTETGGNVAIAINTGDVGTLNLNGGTLTTAGITGGSALGVAGLGASTVNFNGGTLKAQQAAPAFFAGVTTANVRNGGAMINNNGFNVTIGQALLHSTIGGDNPTDGGLTSSGSGTLALTNANSYNGPTLVNAGTLSFVGSGASGDSSMLQVAGGAACQVLTTLPVLATNATVSIGGQLYLTNGANLTVNYLLLNGVSQSPGTWGSSSSGAANQNNTYFSGPGMLTVKSMLVSPEYWTGSGTINQPTSGTWQTGTGTVWSDGNANTADTTWTAGSTAIFGGLDGSYGIKVGGAISVAGMNFLASGYVLTNNSPETITATNSPFITVGAGATDTVGTNVIVTVGLAASFGASGGGSPGGTLIIGGTVQQTNHNPLTISGAGTVVSVQSGGQIVTPNTYGTPLQVGTSAGDDSTLSIDGGAVQINHNSSSIWAGSGGNAQGTLTINSGTVTETGGFVALGVDSGDVGTLNLNGGTLTTENINGGGSTGSSGAGTGIVNFNGGTLEATATEPLFLTGVTTAYVRNGGALINNNGLAITIGQALLHTTNVFDGALDGGLTSSGSGTLTLTNANTYNGSTLVNGGTLSFVGSGASGASSSLQVAAGAVCQVLTTLPVLATNATVSIGGQLYLTNGVNLTVNCLLLNGVYQSSGTWGSSSSSAANQNNTYFSGPGILTVMNSKPLSPEYWVGTSGTLNNPTSGTWQTGTGTVWSDGNANTADTTWTAGSTAIFGGIDSQNITVTVGGAITMGAGGMLFNNSGYTLSASSAQTITGNASGTGIFVAGGKTATIGNHVSLTTSSSSTYMTVGATAANANGGTVDVASGGTLSTGKGMYIQGVGTLVDVLAGGALNTANQSSAFLGIGNGSGSGSTLQMDGGTVTISKNTASIWLGSNPNYSGGGSQGTLTINSGTVTETGGNVAIAIDTGDVGILNLNGGTLTTVGITGGSSLGVSGLGTSIVNFNGGMLTAQNTQASFLGPVTAAYIRNGGAVIYNNGFSITIGQALQHSNNSFDNPVDGGLVELGPGTLTLTNVNTYTGATVVSNGTLALIGSLAGPVVVSTAGTLSAGSAIGPILINNNLTLAGNILIKVNKSSGITNDVVQGVNSLNYGGTLFLNLTNGTWSAGDTMPIFKANKYRGIFTNIVAAPPLATGLIFNTTNLDSNGTIGVIVDTSSPPGFPVGISPGSSTVLVGSSITFATQVTGAVPMAYQWQCNGTNIPNATAVSLTLTNLAVGNSGSYTLVASNAFGTATNPWPSVLTVRPVDDFDTLRWAWNANNTLPTNANLSDPIISNYVVTVGNNANSQWSSMNKANNRTYLWSDAASTNVSADVTTSYLRLFEMAQGWGTPGSSVYSNAVLATDIINGLDWMYTNRYNENVTEYDNWWDWEIGAPNNLNAAACIMWPLLSGTEITNYCNAIDHFSPTVNLTADNRVWKAEVVGVRGVVERNASKVAAARDGLSDVSDNGTNDVFAYVTNNGSDGFFPDGSYIQHEHQPYTGGYGISMLGDTVTIVGWLKPSQWAVTDPLQTNVVNWCYNSFQPLIYYGAMPGFVSGRDISRNGSGDFPNGHGSINGIFLEAQSASTNDAARLNSMVKYWGQVDPTGSLTNYVGINLVPAAEQLMTNTSVVPRGELIGHYRFPSMDRVMHLRPGWGFGISMWSSRIANYESINGENLHGWYTAYGMNYYYTTNNLTQFTYNYWPTVDPYHLPGTTVDLTSLTNSENASVLNNQNWVGGCTFSNIFGVAGMSLADVNTPLVAKKSWFMFDNEVVCLGAGITDSTSTNVNTTVENRLISSLNTNVFTVNGTVMPTTLGWSSNLTGVTWCALDVSGGYYFPNGANLTALRQARSGRWSDLNTGETSTVFTNNYLTLIWDHGVRPNNATYAYVLLPNFTAAGVSNYAANPDITVLTNTPKVQAVMDNKLNVIGANFWTNGYQAVNILTASNQCSVICGESNNVVEIDASDPTWTNTATIALSVNYSCTGVLSADPGVTVVETNPIVKLAVNVNGAHGKSFQTRLSTSVNSPLVESRGSNGSVSGNESNPMTLTGTWNGTNLILNWASSGALCQATNLSGPWTTNVGASPPIRIIPSQPQMFYQLR